MLPGGMNDLTLDGGRALRLAAVVALVVLAVITLPDLFRTPEPPPVPADVGFRPGETVSAPPPVPEVQAPTREKPKQRKDGKRGKPKPDRPPERRNRPDRSGGDGRERPEAPPAQAPVVAPQPAPAAPPPVYVPPPPPAPAPVLPADGSEEFAPGRPG